VCVQRKREREKERKRERERKKTDRKQCFFSFFVKKKNSRQKNSKIKIKKCPGTRAQGCGALVSWYQGSHLRSKLNVDRHDCVRMRENVNARSVSTDDMGNRDEPNRTLSAHI
jgi:hypothetical protein